MLLSKDAKDLQLIVELGVLGMVERELRSTGEIEHWKITENVQVLRRFVLL